MLPPRLRRTDGFALPLTLFLIGILTIMLAAAFTRVAGDRRIAESSGSDQDALDVAQSGLNGYLDSRKTRPPDGDSMRIYVAHGYADVVARIVQRPADTAVNRTYVVRSTGYFLDPGKLGAEPQSRRIVARFAAWQPASMDIRAAFVAANGLRKRGDRVEMRGADACTSANLYALRTPNGGAPNDMDNWTMTGLGSDPHVYESGNGAAVANATDIDWATTISSGGLVPHYSQIMAWDYTYSIQRIVGNATLGTAGAPITGTGLLIVTGDLRTIGTNVQWYGIILVGGKINFNASRTFFDGAVISGLNEQLGQNVPRGDIGDTSVDIDYNSCYVTTALAPFLGLVVRPGWIDAWGTY